MSRKILIPSVYIITLLLVAGCNKKVTTIPATPQENQAVAVASQKPVADTLNPQSTTTVSITSSTPEGATARPAAPPAVWPFNNSQEQPFGIVYFDFDRYDLKPDAKNTLSQLVPILKKFPEKNILIEGHCDERGTIEYNLALGERRAYSVKTYLLEAGIPENRIQTISYGKEKPVDLGHNEEAWAKNRRAALITLN